MRDVLMRAGLYQRLGDRVHNQVHDAVLALTPTGDRAQPKPDRGA